MEMGQAFEEAFVKKPEKVAPKEAFKKLEVAEADLSQAIKIEQDRDGIAKESRLKAGVYLRGELAAELGDLSFDQLMEKAKEKGLKVVFYGGGVAWTGDQWGGREVSDNPNWKPPSLLKLSAEVSAESLSKEKVEEGEKTAALDFLADAGMDICITLDPAESDGFVTSLRADHLAKRTIYDKLLEAKAPSITKVDWSNSGIKEFQTMLAAFEAIAVDLAMAGEITDGFDAMGYLKGMAEQSQIQEKTVRDDIPGEKVFHSGYEAAKYLEYFKKLNMDIFMGGAPANHVELATPFKLTHENPILKHINKRGISLVDNLVHSLRMLAPNRLPNAQKHLTTRIQEMARGKRAADLQLVEDLWRQTRKITRDLLGDVRILTLADTSGSVVTSDRQFVGDDLRAMFGDKVIMVETHDWKPLPRRMDEESAKTSEEEQFRFDRDYSKSQHGELKRHGVLPELRRIMDGIRAGTYNVGREQRGRYVVVEPDATIYEQKKGTEIRLNKLPKLG